MITPNSSKNYEARPMREMRSPWNHRYQKRPNVRALDECRFKLVARRVANYA